jgi:hypothetical protein
MFFHHKPIVINCQDNAWEQAACRTSRDPGMTE